MSDRDARIEKLWRMHNLKFAITEAVKTNQEIKAEWVEAYNSLREVAKAREEELNAVREWDDFERGIIGIRKEQ
jgi:hypothetical protein